MVETKSTAIINKILLSNQSLNIAGASNFNTAATKHAITIAITSHKKSNNLIRFFTKDTMFSSIFKTKTSIPYFLQIPLLSFADMPLFQGTIQQLYIVHFSTKLSDLQHTNICKNQQFFYFIYVICILD